MKKQELTHIGSFIKDIMGACQRSRPDMEMTRIWELWNEAVGPAIAGNARPAAFRGQVLLVTVASSPWMQQLRFLKQDMITKINDALGKELVKEIKFKIGAVS